MAALSILHDRSLGKGSVFSILKPGWFTKAVTKAGIKDFSWHSLRHTFARRLVMASVDIPTVQELMGHKSIVMTMRYAHLSPAHRLVAVEKLRKPTATTTATSEVRPSPVVVQSVQ